MIFLQLSTKIAQQLSGLFGPERPSRPSWPTRSHPLSLPPSLTRASGSASSSSAPPPRRAAMAAVPSPTPPSLYGQLLPLLNLGYNRNLQPLFPPPPLIPTADRYRVPRHVAPSFGPINRPHCPRSSPHLPHLTLLLSQSPSTAVPELLSTAISLSLPGCHTIARAPVRPELGSPCSPLSIVPPSVSFRALKWPEDKLQ
jgi:hypothetical protein